MKYLFTSLLAFLLLLTACKSGSDTEPEETKIPEKKVLTINPDGTFFKMSLAQWSLHKPIEAGTLSPMDFAKTAKEMGFDGIEYVSSMYVPAIKEYDNLEEAYEKILVPLKLKSEQYGVENLIIMVDNEGDLASSDPKEVARAIANHSMWIDVAEYLGCHSVRVNLFGNEDNQAAWRAQATSSLKRLSTYAQQKKINVIVENHGGFSSNAGLLWKTISGVSMSNCGTLPDFGNFCLAREGGARWGAACVEEYDKYRGVEELMPLAKAVSAKSYAFDADGNETTIDYEKMLRIVKDAGYDGYIGVEFEGDAADPTAGISATKNLLIKAAKAIK
ncbi:MAG: sugar phosphate isomerase/epimerase [Flavobacteriales bacterium]|jgi:sugar phosphate isomerase/epimerase